MADSSSIDVDKHGARMSGILGSEGSMATSVPSGITGLSVDLPPPPPIPPSGSFTHHHVPSSSRPYSHIPAVSITPYIFPSYEYGTRPLLPLQDSDPSYIGFQRPDATRNFSAQAFASPFPYGLPPFSGDKKLGSLPAVPGYTANPADYDKHDTEVSSNREPVPHGTIQALIPPPPGLQPGFPIVPPPPTPTYFPSRYPPPPAHLPSGILPALALPALSSVGLDMNEYNDDDKNSNSESCPASPAPSAMLSPNTSKLLQSAIESDAESIMALSPGTEQVPSPIKVDKAYEYPGSHSDHSEMNLSKYEVQIRKVQQVTHEEIVSSCQPEAHYAMFSSQNMNRTPEGYEVTQVSNTDARSSSGAPTEDIESTESSDDDEEVTEDEDYLQQGELQIRDQFQKSQEELNNVGKETGEKNLQNSQGMGEEEDSDDETDSDDEEDESENDDEVSESSPQERHLETTQDSANQSNNSELDSAEDIPKIDSPFTRIRPSLLKSYRASDKYKDKKRSKKKRMLDILVPASPSEPSKAKRRKRSRRKESVISPDVASEIPSESEITSECESSFAPTPNAEQITNLKETNLKDAGYGEAQGQIENSSHKLVGVSATHSENCFVEEMVQNDREELDDAVSDVPPHTAMDLSMSHHSKIKKIAPTKDTVENGCNKMDSVDKYAISDQEMVDQNKQAYSYYHQGFYNSHMNEYIEPNYLQENYSSDKIHDRNEYHINFDHYTNSNMVQNYQVLLEDSHATSNKNSYYSTDYNYKSSDNITENCNSSSLINNQETMDFTCNNQQYDISQKETNEKLHYESNLNNKQLQFNNRNMQYNRNQYDPLYDENSYSTNNAKTEHIKPTYTELVSSKQLKSCDKSHDQIPGVSLKEQFSTHQKSDNELGDHTQFCLSQSMSTSTGGALSAEWCTNNLKTVLSNVNLSSSDSMNQSCIQERIPIKDLSNVSGDDSGLRNYDASLTKPMNEPIMSLLHRQGSLVTSIHGNIPTNSMYYATPKNNHHSVVVLKNVTETRQPLQFTKSQELPHDQADTKESSETLATETKATSMREQVQPNKMITIILQPPVEKKQKTNRETCKTEKKARGIVIDRKRRPLNIFPKPVIVLKPNDDGVTSRIEWEAVSTKGVFCVECNKMYTDGCGLHTTDYHVVADNVLTKARSSLPPELTLRPMFNQDTADYIGVLSRKFIPIKSKFGPLQGKKTTKKQLENPENTAYVWEIFDEENPDMVLDCRSEDHANWLMFVKRARSSLEQNMIVYQQGHEIYFVTIKDIEPDTELLYWYGRDYAVMLGVCTEPEESFRCQCCHRQFPDVDSLRVHIKAAHPALRNYIHRCNDCGKVFKNMSILLRHIKATHGKEKPYSCDVCGKSFSDRNNCRRHKKLHTDQAYSFECEVCSRKFTQKTHLVDHMVTHTGVRNFPCRFCDKLFTLRQECRHHEKTVHIIDKQYKCDQCDAIFNSRRYLNTHMKIHDKKQFHCLFCKKDFTQKVHLKVHLARIHGSSLDRMNEEAQRNNITAN